VNDGENPWVKDRENPQKLDPKSSEGRVQLALCYESKKDYPRAQVLLEEVTQAHPELAAPHRILARVCYHQGKIAEADRQAKIATTIEAQDLKAVRHELK
jgi:Tfp pilus assembly protein PilF